VSRDVVALVSADDFVSAVRVYADRVNDLLRRNGVPALEAVEVAETHSLALLDAVVNAPETVIDLAGWWFARAIEFTTQGGARTDLELADEAISMLAGTLGEAEVRAALRALPDAERAAVVLRDGYDLPEQAVGVALRRGADSTAELTAAGRLRLVAAYDDRRIPDLSGHSGRMAVDLVSLSRLADGTLESPRAAPLRRHAASCPACEEVVECLAKGRRLAAGLPIIAMDDDAREALIDRVGARAEAVLPTHEEVLRAVDEDHDPGPAIPPVLALVALILATTLGIGIALVRHADGSPTAAPTPTHTFQPPDDELFTPSVGPVSRRPRHTASAHPSSSATTKPPRRPSRTTGPSSDPTTKTPPPAIGPAAITLSPAQGRANTTITVTGSGFKPGSLVNLSYAQGRSNSTAHVDADGNFVGELQANALLPGTKLVTARSGAKTASAQFTQQL
jgi:DNA-directed RNA polymerase specialized sigma24 family protein